ncbi:hypothetical protein SAMN06298226_0732 [Nitrosovibrio sp. Nv4]|nr:hypothetical protein SAMN06298226_0732 [Nitrosovibrio sp. Nv4]
MGSGLCRPDFRRFHLQIGMASCQRYVKLISRFHHPILQPRFGYIYILRQTDQTGIGITDQGRSSDYPVAIPLTLDPGTFTISYLPGITR